MATAPHLQHGHGAETLAAQYLTAQGLRLVARNFRARVGELDLVLTEGHILVIVEVRARRRTNVSTPAGSIYRSKCRRVIGATHYFLLDHRQFAHWPVRFDVVEITGELTHPTIRWSRGAFTVDDVVGR